MSERVPAERGSNSAWHSGVSSVDFWDICYVSGAIELDWRAGQIVYDF